MNIPQAIARAKALADKHAPTRFEAKAKGEAAELFIYDAIGGGLFSEGVTPKTVADALAGMKGAKSLSVYINSPGGDVFDGVAIYNEIRRFPAKKTVYVDGIAASAASMIAMAGDEIVMAHNATMMIHEAWGMAVGNAADMRETADLLEKITNDAVLASYARTGQTPDQVRAWMKEEKWMNASEAVDLHFADRIEGGAEAQPERAAAQVTPLVAALAATQDRIAAYRPRTSDKISDATMGANMKRLRERFLARIACDPGSTPACGAQSSTEGQPANRSTTR